MNTGYLIARTGLGVVFLIAAAGKLADLSRFRDGLSGFGVPRRMRGPVALGLPLVELAVGALLVPVATARAGAVAALVLLLGFSAAISRALLRGEHPDCNCFGTARRVPVRARTLVRNLLLAALAGALAFLGPGRSWSTALSGVDLLPVAVGVLAVVVAALAVLTYQLFRQNGRLLERVAALEGGVPATPVVSLPEGAGAPWFSLLERDGALRSLDELLAAGLPLALVFVDPDCAACEPLLGRLEGFAGGGLEIVVITRDDGEASHDSGLETVLLQEDREVARLYGIGAVPTAVIVSPDGRIATRTAVGQEAIEQLLEQHVIERVG